MLRIQETRGEFPRPRPHSRNGTPPKSLQYSGAGKAALINITWYTFPLSLAIHLLKHGRWLKILNQCPRHKSIDIYTNVLTADEGIFRTGWIFIDGRLSTQSGPKLSKFPPEFAQPRNSPPRKKND